MMHNLKACPFCGGRPFIESHSRAFLKGEPTHVAYVRCSECEARTSKIPIDPIGQAEAVKRAVNRWNSRFECVSYIPVGDHRR